MKKFIISIIILIALFSGIGYAQTKNERLSKPFTLTIGDWIAFKTESMIRGNPDLSAPTYVNYDKKSNVIFVEIYGSRSHVEGAKETLLNWWNYITEPCSMYLKDFYNLEIIDTDFTVIYFNKTAKDGPKEIIRLEAGKLLLP